MDRPGLAASMTYPDVSTATAVTTCAMSTTRSLRRIVPESHSPAPSATPVPHSMNADPCHGPRRWLPMRRASTMRPCSGKRREPPAPTVTNTTPSTGPMIRVQRSTISACRRPAAGAMARSSSSLKPAFTDGLWRRDRWTPRTVPTATESTRSVDPTIPPLPCHRRVSRKRHAAGVTSRSVSSSAMVCHPSGRPPTRTATTVWRTAPVPRWWPTAPAAMVYTTSCRLRIRCRTFTPTTCPRPAAKPPGKSGDGGYEAVRILRFKALEGGQVEVAAQRQRASQGIEQRARQAVAAPGISLVPAVADGQMSTERGAESETLRAVVIVDQGGGMGGQRDVTREPVVRSQGPFVVALAGEHAEDRAPIDRRLTMSPACLYGHVGGQTDAARQLTPAYGFILQVIVEACPQRVQAETSTRLGSDQLAPDGLRLTQKAGETSRHAVLDGIAYRGRHS